MCIELRIIMLLWRQVRQQHKAQRERSLLRSRSAGVAAKRGRRRPLRSLSVGHVASGYCRDCRDCSNHSNSRDCSISRGCSVSQACGGCSNPCGNSTPARYGAPSCTLVATTIYLPDQYCLSHSLVLPQATTIASHFQLGHLRCSLQG